MTDLAHDLEQLINMRELSGFKEVLLENARESIALIPRALYDQEIDIGSSKLGGRPDVPEDFSWPVNREKPLSFVIQINFEELAGTVKGVEVLLKSGLLSFFYDDYCWGFRPEDESGFKVYYFPFETAKLKRTVPPNMKPKKVLFGLMQKVEQVREYKSARIGFEKFLSLPEEAEQLGIDKDADCDEYYELLELIGRHHRLLGYSEPIQNSMELECQMVTSGIDCGHRVELAEAAMKKHEELAKDWRLLMQIDSDCENTDMMWGDAGRIYLWIKENDLIAHRFEKAWMISQCH